MNAVSKWATVSVAIVVSAIAMAGCGMTPAAQVASVQTCVKAGLDYEIGKNVLGDVIMVNCVKPKPAVKP